MRDKDNLPAESAQFDTYTNDMWAVRHGAINRFVQAARKVLSRFLDQLVFKENVEMLSQPKHCLCLCCREKTLTWVNIFLLFVNFLYVNG